MRAVLAVLLTVAVVAVAVVFGPLVWLFRDSWRALIPEPVSVRIEE